MTEDKELKRFTTIDDIDKRKKEEARNRFAKDITGTLRNLLDDAKRDMEKRKAELKKQKPLWMKVRDNLAWIILIILFFDVLLGSIWLLIKLIKYFMGFI